ncbi:MAG: hypothetical protein QXS41_00910 [Candidatus Woesearchaeota archaeon]
MEHEHFQNIEKIDINIREDIMEIFNTYDPSPFMEKDLDDDAADYIISSYKELKYKDKVRLVIHIPISQKQKITEDEIRFAIHNFFSYKAHVTRITLRSKFLEARDSMIIAILFLSICLILKNFLLISNNPFFNIIAEGLTIISWVAMWKPVSLFLYDWRPIAKDLKIYEKLANSEIIIKYKA